MSRHEHPGDAILRAVQILAAGRQSTATPWQRRRADALIANLGPVSRRIGLLILLEALDTADAAITKHRRRRTAISDRLILARHPDLVALDRRLRPLLDERGNTS